MRYKISSFELLKQIIQNEPPDDACIEWPRGLTGGYARVQIGLKKFAAHRLAHELASGKTVPPELDVCHKCDNPKCVRPSHLFAGTTMDNIRDCIAKGRFKGSANLPKFQSSPGEKNPSAKLTRDQVAAIRDTYAGGNISQQAIADRFGVSQTNVGAIIRGKIWSVTPHPNIS